VRLSARRESPASTGRLSGWGIAAEAAPTKAVSERCGSDFSRDAFEALFQWKRSVPSSRAILSNVAVDVTAAQKFR